MRTLVLVASNGIYSVSQWGLLVFLARTGDLFVLGSYGFAQALLVPLFITLMWGFRNIVSVDMDRHYSIPAMFRLRLYALAVGLCLTVLYISIFPFSESRSEIVFLLFAFKAAESISDLSYGVSQRDREIVWQARSITFRALLVIFVLGIAWVISLDYLAALVALAAVSLAFSFIHDGSSLLKSGQEAEKGVSTTGYLLRAGAPLVVASAIGAVAVNSPRYALEYIHGTELLGAFTAIYSFSVVLNLIGISIGQSHVSSLAKAFRNGDRWRYWSKVVEGSLILGACVLISAIITYFFGRTILSITFGPEVGRYGDLLYVVVICCYPLVASQFLAYASVATGGFVSSAVVNGVVLAVGLPATIFLVNDSALVGACYAVGIIGLLNAIGFSLAIYRMWHRRDLRRSDEV